MVRYHLFYKFGDKLDYQNQFLEVGYQKIKFDGGSSPINDFEVCDTSR